MFIVFISYRKKKEAEKEAEAYNVLVVGVLEGFINFTEDNVWNRVLH